MKILVVSATLQEIAPCVSFLDQHQIDYLVTGVGMTATAFELGYYLQKHTSIDLIINVGIAGSFSKDIAIGEVVQVISDSFIELGAEDGESFLTIEELGFGRSIYNAVCRTEVLESLPTLKKTTGVTVNRVHGNVDSISKLRKRIANESVESMEGAAVFFAAHRLKIDVIQLRSVSNYVEPRDKSTWNIPLAIKQLNENLEILLKNLLKIN